MPIVLTGTKPSKIPQNPKTIGDHIRKRRLELGLLQREVAEQIVVEVDTILNWEHGRSTPQLRYLHKVISFLGYDPASSEPRSLGEKALRYRKSQGVSQRELAKQIGIDPTTLSKMERRNDKCSRSTIKKVSTFLSTRL